MTSTMKSLIILATLITIAFGAKISHRIVNGAKADRDQFPYQATLVIKQVGFWGSVSYQPFCGATIISDQWLLTAAHCSLGIDLRRDLDRIKVIIGVHRLDHEDRIVADIETYVPHQNFRMNPVTNDIGVIKIKGSIPLSGTGIVPAKLPAAGEVFKGTAVNSGHGLIDPRYQNSVSEHLMWLNVNIEPDTECSKRWEYRFSQTRFDPKTMICGAAAPGKSPCNGDSGGPLVKQSVNTVIGVVSFGPKDCGRRDTPFVFTKVSAYRDWIKRNSGV